MPTSVLFIVIEVPLILHRVPGTTHLGNRKLVPVLGGEGPGP